jgi:regulator of protease activity HflC (stomatin/prohibitin superfamily)
LKVVVEGVMSCCCFICVEQSEVALIESWGRFTKLATPGCHCLIPCKDSIAGKVSLRLEEMQCHIDSKSKDNVFLSVSVSIQYQILFDSVEKAFYTLEDAERQIEAYVHNSVRGKVPQYDLDEIYSMRGEISKSVKEEIDHHMDAYGYEIVTVLLTDIDPATSVTNAMNLIQTNSRLKAATVDKSEALKIAVVKAAEADAEAKRLSGVGLAEQRKAIVAGLQTSIEQFQEGVPGLTSEDVMSLLLMNQYFDTLKDVAKVSQGTTLFLSHSGGLRDVARHMDEGIITKKHA